MRFDSFLNMFKYYADNGDGVALVYDDGDGKKEIRFSGLIDAVNARKAELAATGKTSIGIFCSGKKDCIITIFAAVAAKMQVVMLDESLSDKVLAAQIQKADIDMLWADDGDTVKDFEQYMNGGVEKDAGRILFFTSGTTSAAKAVVLTEQSLCASAYNGSQKLPLTADDTLLCVLPLSHVFGFVCSLLWGLSCGAKVALGRGTRQLMVDFDYFKPTAVSLVPMLLGFLLKNELLNEELNLILVGAGDCPDSLLEAVAAMGKRVCFGYGLTETSSGVAISVSGDVHAMEICPDDEIKIADDGEILIKAPTCIMQGYYKDDESTAAALKDGWLYSGDLGSFDSDGKLYITGRKKEILVLPTGTKIFLPEYEGAIAKALGNSELAVILLRGKPVLIIRESEDMSEELLTKVASVMRELPQSQRLSQVIFKQDPLPRTPTGKIKRWELQKTEEEKYGNNNEV